MIEESRSFFDQLEPANRITGVLAYQPALGATGPSNRPAEPTTTSSRTDITASPGAVHLHKRPSARVRAPFPKVVPVP
jgi:hypothetical protein